VTGGAGYIGSHIVLEPLSAGRRPVVLDNLTTGSLSLVPKTVPFFKADVADHMVVRDVLRRFAIKDVIHCAASLNDEESMRDPIKYWKNKREPAHAGLYRIIPDTLNWEKKLHTKQTRSTAVERVDSARTEDWRAIRGGLLSRSRRPDGKQISEARS
jgi:dTDP-D-glucose 4,6-dehydratase